MAEPVWMPADYCEETSPAGRASPSDWIVSDDQGRPCLAKDWGEKEPAFALEDGRVIKFLRHIDHGAAVLTFTADGSASVSSPMPRAAEQCCAMEGWQSETLADSVDELIEQLKNVAEPSAGDTFDVAYYTFEGPIPFRFDAATRAFVQVAS